MNIALKTSFAASVFGILSVASHVQAATVPCEDMLKDYRAAKATAKVSDATMKKADELEAKAVERCNADDDKRSDQFLTEAMKLIGK